MSADQTNYGSISAAGASLGPHGELKVNKATGQVDFAIGTPTPAAAETFPLLGAPTYTTVPGTNITSATKMVDSVQILNNWLGTYLLDSPPAVTNLVAVSDTSKITLTWTNPSQKLSAFTTTTLPCITAIKADVILSSSNAGGTFAGATTTTLQTLSGSSMVTCNSLELYVDSGSSALSGTTYKKYSALTTQLSYDIRIYCVNNSSQATKYTVLTGKSTLSVGVPTAPSSAAADTITKNSARVTYAAPQYRDSTTPVVSSTPYLSAYRFTRAQTTTKRYGGLYADAAPVYTQTETPTADKPLFDTISSLNPGTGYSVTVAAKNSINSGFSAESAAATFTSSYPTPASFLATTDCSTMDSTVLPNIRYDSNPLYQLDGTTSCTYVFKYSTLAANPPRLTVASAKRVTADYDHLTGLVGDFYAYSGPTASSAYLGAAYAAHASIQGLDDATASASATSSNSATKAELTSMADQASTPLNEKGFVKVATMTAVVNDTTQFTAGASSYSMAVNYTPVGGSAVTTNAVAFYVDNLTAATAATEPAITSVTGASWFAGVPTLTSTAVLQVQWNQTNVASYFLRNDRNHAVASILKSGGAGGSIGTVTASKTNIGANHKYWVKPSPAYSTSSTLHNTAGTQLAPATSDIIQFNDYTVTISAASTLDENVVVQVTPYNTVGTGAAVTDKFVDPSTGAKYTLRIDSVSADKSSASNATSATGQHVKSGTGAYPALGSAAGQAGDAYDHTASLLSSSDLLQYNNRWQTPAVGGYSDYSGVKVGSNAGFNYSTITADSSVRYVTFKYTVTCPKTYAAAKATISFGGTTGLTVSPSTDSANHSLDLKVVDSTVTTGWLNTVKSALPVDYPTTDGGAIGYTTSTATVRRFYLPSTTGTSGTTTIYLRIGLPNNLNAYVNSITFTMLDTITA